MARWSTLVRAPNVRSKSNWLKRGPSHSALHAVEDAAALAQRLLLRRVAQATSLVETFHLSAGRRQPQAR